MRATREEIARSRARVREKKHDFERFIEVLKHELESQNRSLYTARRIFEMTSREHEKLAHEYK